MGFFSDEMKPMLGVFESETTELIANIDAIIGRVEQAGAFSPEDVAELFRHAHTTKGSSAMMGLDDLARLTHRVEDLFDCLRNDPTSAGGHVADILDHLYAYSDYVKDELARMEAPDFEPANADDLIARVSADIALLGDGEADVSPAVQDDNPELGEQAGDKAEDDQADGLALPDDLPAERATVKVSFKTDVPMVNARALVVTKQVAAKVNLMSYLPADLTDPASVRQINDSGLLLTMAPDDVEEAKQVLAKNSFIRRIVVLDEAAVGAASTRQEGKGPAAPSASSGKFVTLRWDAVHGLQDLAGEFLLELSRLRGIVSELPAENEMKPAVSRVGRLVDDLVYRVNSMSMVSIASLVPQLSRMVRDMSRETDKRISFEVHGGDIEIDRNLYNSIADPLLHIVRNAVDHGIESPEKRLAAGKDERGVISLMVESLGGRVVFRVADDGCGIDTDKVLASAAKKGLLDKPAENYSHAEALMLIMKPGFSTAGEVTQYSGRGVGMDVVNTVMRDFGGSVEIESHLGQGTSISLFMPVSVTSIDSLGFHVGPYVCQLPLRNLDKVYAAAESAERLSTFEGAKMFTHDDQEIPVLDMHALFGCEGETKFYIVCHSFDDLFAIAVDDVIGNLTCANKPLPMCLDQKWQVANCIRNAAIMDDGAIGYTMSAALLAQAVFGIEVPIGAPEATGDAASTLPSIDTDADLPDCVFVFDLGDQCYALAVEPIERVVAHAECSSVPHGMPYLIGLVNYRNHVVPVFDLARSADSAGAAGEAGCYLIVTQEGGKELGFALTSAVGVRETASALLSEEPFEPKTFAAGVCSIGMFSLSPKEPPITLLGIPRA